MSVKQSLTDRVIGLISSVSAGQAIAPSELPDLIRATGKALIEVERMAEDSAAAETDGMTAIGVKERPIAESRPQHIEEPAEVAPGKGLRTPGNPAAPIGQSVTPDYIVCLEDGQKMKMLKRHLMSRYSMTPDEYRAKWGLPPDYPMIAPGYAYMRSLIAKQTGFGSMPAVKKGRRA